MFMGDRQIEQKIKQKVKQKITPTLMFVGEQCGKAEEAINFYASGFHNVTIGWPYSSLRQNEEPETL